jgi:hypothetical protein
MGRSYEQLSLEDRCEIARLSADGSSVRQIVAALDRSPSTISRELKRNQGAQVGYKPGYAQQQTRARRWKGSRLERDESLRAAVIERLASGWSPEQIAGRLKLERRRTVISYESTIASSMPSLPAPGTIAGGTICCPVARASAAAAVGRAEALKTSLKAVFPWQNGRSRRPAGAIGRSAASRAPAGGLPGGPDRAQERGVRPAVDAGPHRRAGQAIVPDGQKGAEPAGSALSSVSTRSAVP